MDRDDPLRYPRQRFQIPQGLLYLDGNSLGALPKSTPNDVMQTITKDWGERLIGSWNDAGWVNLPATVAAKLAPLLGVQAGEVVIADSTSVNLFKLLSGVLLADSKRNGTTRRWILSERDNFPTDLYIAEGVLSLFGDRYALKLVAREDIGASIDDSVAVALITHVDYRTGHLHDMRALCQRADVCGVELIWDLSHSAGAVPLDLAGDGANYAVGCGYKYLNGGPGAPGYAYVRQTRQATLPAPLSGWFGHAAPFAFLPAYQPAPDIRRLLCGTPSVLAMIALGSGIDTFDGVSMIELRKKSLALSDLFWQLVDQRCAGMGLRCVSPVDHATRASQLSFAHPAAFAVMQALISRGVIGDFRQPNLMRFGFTPLYTRFTDCWDAIDVLEDVLRSEVWRQPRFSEKKQVP
jgi:kynureninase